MNTSYTALQYEPVTTVEQSIASVVVSVQRQQAVTQPKLRSIFLLTFMEFIIYVIILLFVIQERMMANRSGKNNKNRNKHQTLSSPAQIISQIVPNCYVISFKANSFRICRIVQMYIVSHIVHVGLQKTCIMQPNVIQWYDEKHLSRYIAV